jgi:hypothetical protein
LDLCPRPAPAVDSADRVDDDIDLFLQETESWHAARHRTVLASSGVADSFEAFKDEVKPEFELVRVVVAGLQNVPHR